MRWCTTSSAAISIGTTSRNLTWTSASSRNGTATPPEELSVDGREQPASGSQATRRNDDDAPPLKRKCVVGQVRTPQ